ncbi:SHOCT domain-containing protein [Nonomuraea sediminis]|uniref:SHOCT domain-containing protein n=1 Tax=Nonomuraea sediminis TaxID=2835864 RepID=UPI001BDD03E7|nr:SHOCT domain-containing protein [Nonomuraea sediminis]
MGVFLRPRRPLLRAAAGAATAAVAYKAGKNRATQDQYNEQAEAAYQATQQPPPQAYQQPPPPQAYQQPPPQPPADPLAELERLARLHQSGALTDEEFAAMKSRVIGG